MSDGRMGEYRAAAFWHPIERVLPATSGSPRLHLNSVKFGRSTVVQKRQTPPKRGLCNSGSVGLSRFLFPATRYETEQAKTRKQHRVSVRFGYRSS